jgi:hypothetical protein
VCICVTGGVIGVPAAGRRPPMPSPVRVTPSPGPFVARPAPAAPSPSPVVNHKYDPAAAYAPLPARRSASKDNDKLAVYFLALVECACLLSLLKHRIGIC